MSGLRNVALHPTLAAKLCQPAMPAPVRPGLPDDVLAILTDTHAWRVRLMRHFRAAEAERPDHAPSHRRLWAEDDREARRIRQALRTSGHFELADALTAEAWGIVPKPSEGVPS